MPGTQLVWLSHLVIMILRRKCKEIAALLIAQEDRTLALADRLALRLHLPA